MCTQALYCLGALALTVISGVIMYYALFRDRSRGRKRCPKCWYDMQGANSESSLRCPECGHDAMDEKRLYTTRRRWKAAFVGSLVLLLAGFVALQPKVQEDGWASLLPTTAVIYGLRYTNSDWPILEMVKRSSEFHDIVGGWGFYMFDESLMTERQWSRFFHAVLDKMSHERAVDRRKTYMYWFAQAQFLNLDPSIEERIRLVLRDHVSDPDHGVQSYALFGLQSREEPAELISLVQPILDSGDAQRRRNAMSSLRTMLRDGKCEAIGPLLTSLSDPDVDNRRFSVLFLSYAGQCSDDIDRVIAALEQLADDPDPEVRASRVTSIATLLDDDEAEAYITERLDSDVESDRVGAIDFIASKCEEMRPEDAGRLVAALHDESQLVRQWAAWGVQSCDPEHLEPFVEELAAALLHDDPEVVHAIRRTVRRVPGLRDAIERRNINREEAEP